jgi:hypothetical protein
VHARVHARAEPRICTAAAAVGFGVGSGVTYWLLAEGKLPLPARAVGASVGAGAAAVSAAEALRHPAAAHGLPSGSETLRVRRRAAALCSSPPAPRTRVRRPPLFR